MLINQYSKFILISLLSINFLFSHSNQETQIKKLETKITELEQRIKYLETLIVNKSNKELITSGSWKNKKNWRKLELGMSMDNVENILGEPHKVDGGSITTWYYNKSDRYHSHVKFYKGRLDRWTEPE